jgi:mortality factor 4-like protein 1
MPLKNLGSFLMPTTFGTNDRVLCYHGPLIYEAKVLKTATLDETTSPLGVAGAHYYVHYKGWKQTCVHPPCSPFRKPDVGLRSRWDEWVPSERILEMNESNITASSSTSHKKGATASGSKDTTARTGRKDGTRGTKRGREEVSLIYLLGIDFGNQYGVCRTRGAKSQR